MGVPSNPSEGYSKEVWFNANQALGGGPVLAYSGQNTATATHAAATLSFLAPPTGYAWALDCLFWSYAGGTPAGGITVSDGTATYFQASSGAGTFTANLNIQLPDAKALIVTLADGSANVVGCVNAYPRLVASSAASAASHAGDTVPLPGTLLYGLDFTSPINSQYL